MLYRIIKVIMTVALRLAFRRIEVHGREYLDNGQPTIILANHTASFMDALLTGVLLKRKIHFFTRGDVFTRHSDKWLRRLGMLPIHRLSEGKDKMHGNERTNSEAIEILRQGGAVLIFPEGVSEVEKMLKPLKKGPFRLAEAAKDALGKAPLIVPLGINYMDPVRTGTEVFFIAGRPLPEPPAAGDASKKVLDRMRMAETALKAVVWNAGDVSRALLADEIIQHNANRGRLSFEEVKSITDVLRDMPEDGLHAYIQSSMFPWRKSKSILARLTLLMIAVPAFAGYIGHIIPLGIAKSITEAKVKMKDFILPVYVALTIIFVLVWYVLLFACGLMFIPAFYVLAGIAVIALCGVIYVKGWKRLAG